MAMFAPHWPVRAAGLRCRVSLLVLLITVLAATVLEAGAARTVRFDGVEFLIYEAGPGARFRFFWKRDDGTLYNTIAAVKRHLEKQGEKLAFATNGGMFHLNREPVGLYVEAERELFPLNVDAGWGNFFMKPNGVFAVTGQGPAVVETDDYSRLVQVTYATQSGPMLLTKGRIHPAFKRYSDSLFLRSGVGIDGKGNAVFAISKEKLNLHHFARLFRDELGASAALYLDGGISRIHLAGRPLEDGGTLFGPIITIIAPCRESEPKCVD